LQGQYKNVSFLAKQKSKNRKGKHLILRHEK